LARIIVLLLTTSGACMVMSLLPSLAWLGGIAWGIALFLGGHAVDRRLLVSVAGANVLLLFGLSGNSNLFFIMSIGLPALVMGLLLSDGRDFNEIQNWGVLASVILVILFWSLAQYSDNPSIRFWDQSQMETYVAESLKTSQDMGLVEVYIQQGLSREELEQDIVLAARWLYMHLPALYMINVLFGIWLVLRLGAIIGNRRGMSGLKPKPYAEEMMPWQLSWLVIAALTVWLWGRDEPSNIYYFASNVLAVMIPVTAYFGLAVQAYKLGKMKPQTRRWGWSIFLVAALLFTPLAIVFISFLGLFDSLVDYRKLNQIKEATP